MNKIERAIYDVNLKMKDLNEKLKEVNSEINAINACLKILEKIRDDKFIKNEENKLDPNSSFLNAKQL
jgi:hypothetical protein